MASMEGTNHAAAKEEAVEERPNSSSTEPSSDSTHESDPISHPPPTKKRSVSFSSLVPPDRMERRRSRLSQHEQEVEDSADETTAIVRSARGGDKNYKTVAQGQSTATAEGTDNQACNGLRSRAARTWTRPQSGHSDSENEQSWLKRTMEKYGSVELDNKGSVARDHLALERTFLAWLRTSLSFASIGIAVTQLFRLNTSLADSETTGTHTLRHVGKPLGATFVGVSIVTLFIGFHRYFESQHYIIRGKFPASRGSVLLVAFITGALIVSSLIVILVIAPTAFEKR